MKKWIVSDAQHLGGAPRVRDTRISVALILESLAVGMSVDQIVDAYPSLTPELFVAFSPNSPASRNSRRRENPPAKSQRNFIIQRRVGAKAGQCSGSWNTLKLLLPFTSMLQSWRDRM